jgi:hypothetical protein
MHINCHFAIYSSCSSKQVSANSLPSNHLQTCKLTTNMHEYQNFSEDVENVESLKFLKKSLLAHDI